MITTASAFVYVYRYFRKTLGKAVNFKVGVQYRFTS